MATKTRQIQIRVTPREKRAIQRLARRAGRDVSSYVLGRVLPPARDAVEDIVRALRREEDARFALAALADLLRELPAAELAEALGSLEVAALSPRLQNTVAAMVEEAAYHRGIPAPPWTREVEPLEEPCFAVPFARLRPHLLRSSPAAFKRRNLFVDSSVGDRV